MANTLNESGAFNVFEEHGGKSLGEIFDTGTAESKLKGINSVYSTVKKNSDAVDCIINTPVQ